MHISILYLLQKYNKRPAYSKGSHILTKYNTLPNKNRHLTNYHKFVIHSTEVF